MKKIIYLMGLVLAFSGCSVESYEELISADAQLDFVEDPYTFYSGKSGNEKGYVSITNDCGNIIVSISAAEKVDNPEDAFLGVFTELPELNNGDMLEEQLPYSLEDAENLTWTIPYDDSNTSYYVFVKAWGDYAGTIAYEKKITYLVYDITPVQCDVICLYGFGYWKTHGPDSPGNQEDVWPMTDEDYNDETSDDQLVLGDTEYNKMELLEIMRTPVEGDVIVSLKHHLIATKFNIMIGGNDSEIGATVSLADEMIINPTEYSKDEINAVKDALEAYNESSECED